MNHHRQQEAQFTDVRRYLDVGVQVRVGVDAHGIVISVRLKGAF